MGNMSDETRQETTGVSAVTSADAMPHETGPTGRRLKDLMTRDVIVVHPDDRLQTAAEKMKELHVGALPVDDGTRLLGMITERDILTRAVARGYDPWEAKVRGAMTDAVIYGYEDQTPEEALRIMEEHHIRRLVVMDVNRRMVGIVSRDTLTHTRPDSEHIAERAATEQEPLGPKR